MARVTGDMGSIPGSGRFPGELNGNRLQYSGLESVMDGGAWWARVHDVTKAFHMTAHTSKAIDVPGRVNVTLLKFKK